ncbi:MAG: RluA family pseudouridine synthase [Clostridia bacterium]|nr:RluA family pseudouridine synthase [Clostridia bacterium]
MDFRIKQKDHGRLVRDFLRSVGVSAALSAKLKRREEGILLNGSHVTVRAVLQAGDVLTLAIEDDAPSEKLLPLSVEPDILRETAHYLVVNKPPFMPTHPSHGHFTDTLANALVYALGNGDTAFRPRFINRLDRNTSGAVLVARHALSAAVLSRAMAEGAIRKGYLALVKGHVTAGATVQTGIRRREESIIFRETCAMDEGDPALTVMTPLCCSDAVSLVKLEPKTGRTHQLRVHMAHIGHPILGDELYGEADAHMERHALHAAFLSFPDPVTGEETIIHAPLPEDMAAVLQNTFGEEGSLLAKAAFC